MGIKCRTAALSDILVLSKIIIRLSSNPRCTYFLLLFLNLLTVLYLVQTLINCYHQYYLLNKSLLKATHLIFLNYQSFLYLLRALVQIDAVAIWLRVVVLPTVNKASKEQITIFLLVLCAIYCTVYK